MPNILSPLTSVSGTVVSIEIYDVSKHGDLFAIRVTADEMVTHVRGGEISSPTDEPVTVVTDACPPIMRAGSVIRAIGVSEGERLNCAEVR